ncbi:MSHA biogenesis protein MshJ [Actimicrobium sp. CCI2.3]|uniref:MSHA biogenesis protein MshJ n=1 Tax=Actimicrobium sp. CCI2.3 TaxID=3048616 RepID=UPI002AB3D7DB|nr:MSHA biogenesis protein MshJ [Actimicrobium sp. CCI2.3]MDY7572939.1 MSHA biogenesis protein MshJ [Actimicrobium sp. CCI2.3]MEB0020784.1 MSHA biogenesis protein MshJ [Actimicrobium sp. CCI2.3]
MRAVLQRLRRAVDTLSLRERGVLFLGALLALALSGKIFLFDPQYARQQKLHDQIRADTAKTAVMHAEITHQMQGRVSAADAVKQAMLAALQGQSQGLRGELSDINRLLVKPDDMAALLGDILMRHQRLRLVSFTTLPATNLLAGLTSAASTPANPGDIYKHRVELVVQGNYLDMLTYMVALEAIPSRLFWAKAVLHVDTYPEATLTLSLFTLSLDKKWLSL